MSPVTPEKVLVVGESLVDVVESHGERSAHPGGSPLNVAFGLSRLDVATVFATEFGSDPYGDAIRAHLEGAGVEVVRSTPSVATSVATARLDASGAADYTFALDWRFDASGFGVPALLHTGSIAAVHEPGASSVRRLIEELSTDTLVSYDPNVRPAVMPGPEHTRDLVAWYCRKAHLVKLSDEDAAWLFPGWDPQAVLDWVLAKGARVAVLTCGAEGSILRSPSAEVTVAARATAVVDTIGAGDAYMAGLIWGVVNTLGLEHLRSGDVSRSELAALGDVASAVAALTVARRGAEPPTLRELQRSLAASSVN